MAAELDLDPPLPEDVWVHGEEAPTDGTNDFGDTNFGVPEPITYTVAQVIEEMINALQVRRDYIQLDRYSFAFGIGTGDATGALIGLADNQEEFFAGGFVSRPVIVHAADAGDRYLARYLKRGGTYTGEADAHYKINFTAEGGTPGWAWQWNFGPWEGPFPFSWLEREMDDGITIQWVNNAGPSWIMAPAIKDDTEWIIKAYTKLRRTDHAIAYVLLTELMDALEETVLGNDDASIDFGDGPARARISWTSPTYDDYEGKFLLYDTDVERLSGFESIAPIGASPPSDDPLKKGMDGAIMQIRGMLNDLRWASAVEIPLTSDGVGQDHLKVLEVIFIDTPPWALLGDTITEPGLLWRTWSRVRNEVESGGFYLDATQVAQINNKEFVRADVSSSVVLTWDVTHQQAPGDFVAIFMHRSIAVITRFVHSDELEPKVLKLRYRVAASLPGNEVRTMFATQLGLSPLLDAAGPLVIPNLAVYGDTPNGDLKALFEAGSPRILDATQMTYDPFRVGPLLANNDGQEIIIVMPKKEIGGQAVETYIALVGSADRTSQVWDDWVPSTPAPEGDETGRGYDSFFKFGLELL